MTCISILCLDRPSGERFSVPAGDDTAIVAAIEEYIRAGIDGDTGTVAYDVETDDGRHFAGLVDPD